MCLQRVTLVWVLSLCLHSEYKFLDFHGNQVLSVFVGDEMPRCDLAAVVADAFSTFTR